MLSIYSSLSHSQELPFKYSVLNDAILSIVAIIFKIKLCDPCSYNYHICNLELFYPEPLHGSQLFNFLRTGKLVNVASNLSLGIF